MPRVSIIRRASARSARAEWRVCCAVGREVLIWSVKMGRREASVRVRSAGSVRDAVDNMAVVGK